MRAFLLFVLLLFFITGCEIPNQTTYTGAIKGYVYDDSIKTPVSEVKIWADEITDTVYTSITGMFYIKDISMPRGEYDYTLRILKPGYIPLSYYIFVKSDELTVIDSIFIKRQ